MTKDDINRKISEAKEPYESLPALDENCADITPSRCWLFHSRPDWHWRPVDWTGSEGASAELLDEMRPVGMVIERNYVQIRRIEPGSPLTDHEDRKTAIALAWLKWKETHGNSV